MNIVIREAAERDFDSLVAFTLSAFEPIFDSFASILGPSIYAKIYPDWRVTQENVVKDAYRRDDLNVYVAELNGTAVGLITYRLNHEHKVGEVEFLVVHPDYQNDGVGTRLNQFALQQMTDAGMELAEVGTGGDDSHAPARRAYEKAGYTALPLVRYYKKLS